MVTSDMIGSFKIDLTVFVHISRTPSPSNELLFRIRTRPPHEVPENRDGKGRLVQGYETPHEGSVYIGKSTLMPTQMIVN